jgi:cell division protein FtsI/penicillin-binding protein 2
MRRSLLGAGAAVCVAALAVVATRARGGRPSSPAAAAIPVGETAALLPRLLPPLPPKTAPLAGIDLTRIALGDDGATVPAAEGRVAHLTLDPELQRAADRILGAHHLPESAAVLVDVATGRILAYASHLEHGEKRDLCVEATAPSASVFKIVTGAALVENANLSPDTRECYAGGEQKILPSDIEDDPHRDRWCTTLAGAMGHSTNAVFAKLALHNLKHTSLEEMAGRLGYNDPVPFDVPVQKSTLTLPSDPLGYARTAAGFWNSTLSPLEAASLSLTVARGGDVPRLAIVDQVVAGDGTVVYSAPEPSVARRAMQKDTAAAVTKMMEVTVAEGTSYRAFHDGHGTAFLPGVTVAGKTGTLTQAQEQRYYTWFTGFAPTRPIEAAPKVPQVAVAVLVVNGPEWHVKANVLAREILREYFARQGVPGITAPTQRAEAERVARRE